MSPLKEKKEVSQKPFNSKDFRYNSPYYLLHISF